MELSITQYALREFRILMQNLVWKVFFFKKFRCGRFDNELGCRIDGKGCSKSWSNKNIGIAGLSNIFTVSHPPSRRDQLRNVCLDHRGYRSDQWLFEPRLGFHRNAGASLVRQ